MRLVFGTDFTTPSPQDQSMKHLEQFWHQSTNNNNSPNPGPWNFFGISPALLKSLVLTLIGVVVQFVLFLIKRNKTRKLEQIRKEEEEEKARILEAEWQMSQELFTPEMRIVKDIDRSEFEEIKAFDGELNSMAFNHVKSSKAFAYSAIEEMDEDDDSLFDTTDSITRISD
jgi:hypothetical protein